MKIIAGFDCAASNMGICYIEFDDKWHGKIKIHVLRLNKLYNEMEKMTQEQFVINALQIVRDIQKFIDNIIHIKFFNVIDLVPCVKVAKVPTLERTKRLKYLLHVLDQQFGTPDIVLIEYQMKQNDISRSISYQIAYHYVECNPNISVEQKNQCAQKKSLCKTIMQQNQLSNSITYAIDTYPLTSITMNTTHQIVDIVGTSLKNAYSLSPDGEYANFISKYSNYTANKKHTTHNFLHYVKTFSGNKKEELQNISNKTDDIADSFMMIYGWLKKQNMI